MLPAIRELPALARAESALREAFARSDFREAHRRAQPILLALEKQEGLLQEIVKSFVLSLDRLHSRRINPVVAIPLLETEAFTLVANIWLPRPDGRTDISHQSIHHHGNLLLTSVAAYGPGYESIVFHCDKAELKKPSAARMTTRQLYQNDRGKIEFVDSQEPHVVFYPAKLSVTYALWSKDRPYKTTGFRFLRVPASGKAAVRGLLNAIGIGSYLGLNQSDGLDYTVREGSVLRLPKRVQYRAGSRDNLLGALRYIVREIGLRDAEVDFALGIEPGQAAPNEFEADHMHLADANLLKAEVLACTS